MNETKDEAPKPLWTEKEIRGAFQELANSDLTQIPSEEVRGVVRGMLEEWDKKSFADKEASRKKPSFIERK